MRKFVVSVHSTANNVITGPPSGDETDFMQWAQPGIDESSHTFLTYLDNVDTIVLGRGTYQDLVRKWPKVKEWPDVPEVALRMGERVNTAKKFVVTDSLDSDSLEWGEYEPATRISGANLIDQITMMKREDGGDLMSFGSPILVRSLANARLVDEYLIVVHPVIVDVGRRLFEDFEGRTDLRLLGVDRFSGGAMIVRYAVAR